MAIDTLVPSAAQPAPATPRRRPLDTVLTVVGELLITAGVLLGLFVVWQLFYTDVQSGRIQDAALEELPWFETPPAVEDASGGSASTVPLISEADKHFTPEGAPTVAEPATGDVFATMYVPRWGGDYVKPIAQGVSRKTVLDRLGIGHYPGRAMPGEIGNFAVAGHRTTYGKPFADVDLLQQGDALIVQTAEAWFVYRVTTWEIVRPTHIDSIAANPFDPHAAPTQALITLTTCHPKFSAAQRWVVHGELEYWAFTTAGYPAELYGSA